jgi:hypothetical protein
MKNIVENNRLIAEFLNWEFDDLSETFETPFLKLVEPQAFGDEQFSCKLQDFELEFHSDWNWLMEVVEKIHSMQSYGVLINPNGTYIQDEDDKVICMTFKNEEVNGEIISSSNIEATFNCCVEFVNWYNEQK